MQTETYIVYIIPYISIKGIHIGYIIPYISIKGIHIVYIIPYISIKGIHIVYIIPYISIKGIHIGYIGFCLHSFFGFIYTQNANDCDEFESFTILLCKTIHRYILL